MRNRTILLALILLIAACGPGSDRRSAPTPTVWLDATWEDIPLYPDSAPEAGYPREMYFPGKETVWTWLYHTTASPEEVHNFYLAVMPRLGWQLRRQTEAPLSSDWGKDNNTTATISLTGESDGTRVALARTERQAGSAPTETPAASNSASPMVPLNTLKSYRATVITRRMAADGTVTEETVKMTWVRTPPAVHFINPTFSDHPEVIAIGERSWEKTDGGWVPNMSLLDVNIAFTQADRLWMSAILGHDYDYFWQEATLVGGETVNGVQSRHYILDMRIPPDQTTRIEVWIADQDDLPPVPVRGIYETNKAGVTTLHVEADVTDINAPLTIQPPE